MRLLIVDDEAPARQRLRRLLAAMADVEVVAEAVDGESALAAVAQYRPDAVLLDIRMPGFSGLDVAASLPDPAPAIVFVTAFGEYALSAFDAAAIDYLLKPVEPARLARAIDRLRRHQPRVTVAAGVPEKLLIPDRGRVHVIARTDIVWLESADNYVMVHTSREAPLMRRTLAGLLDDLGPEFVRCHRGAAVALACVSEIRRRPRGVAMLFMNSGHEVPCSRAYREAVIQALGQRH